MFDVKKVRATLLWGIPLYLGLMAGSCFVIRYEIIPTVVGIATLASGVRIAPAALLAPFIALICALAIILGTMRAIPCSDKSIQPMERFFTIIVLASGVALLLIPVTSLIVRFYMPSLGYSLCSDLKDNPTMWFTDWVRDPAWCVRGKSLDWVNQQGR
ncbi:hypothetical protein AVME950_07545 [Acidovorax sp. SUPP950]|uniref:hypothetical protein n=1 Tax=unclassified Acidovorax TaxID=2684926 RepID=UPI0023CDFF2F|nr:MULTISPECIES: hypothetical protein [unclassified Acidovorax]GKS74727.1 hypothetical protein AVME950_07545 [Acidovorax sp. SUPP950]GKS93152.1 hypothetical protein AVAK2825_01475 [Acidovorax sp. SUPP2825]GKS99322.1 hypothetical protein AVKW3434_08060 [Acidovorax sp. SUPP3434]